MAELWELICHHNYKGVPGVVFDRSALGASHGRAWDLDDSEFWANGITPDSGCVNFRGDHVPAEAAGYIHVPAQHNAWRNLEGIKGEVTLKLDDITGWGFVLSSNSFRLCFRRAHPSQVVPGAPILCAQFHSTPDAYRHYETYRNSTMITYQSVDYGGSQAGGLDRGPHPDPIVPYPFPIPFGRWITVGFMYDGFNTVEIYVNGEKAADAHYPYTPLHPLNHQGLNIGAFRAGRTYGSFVGQIDDVKIWRLNPRRYTEEFFSRPMDGKTVECWKRFQREIASAFRRHPDCVAHLFPLFKQLLDGLLREVHDKGPETGTLLENSARQYNALWRAGKIDGPEMAKVFDDLITWFRLVGIDIENNPILKRIMASECFTLILSELKLPDCDKQAMKLLESIVKSLGGSVSRKSGGADR